MSALRSARPIPGLCALGVLSAALVAGSTPDAQAPKTQIQAPVVSYATDVSVVQVDAIILDADGRFVTNLRRDEIEVLEDRKPQVLAGFELVSLPAPPAGPVPPAVLDSRSNARPFEGRLYILVLDDLHINAARTVAARTIARKFIDESFLPGDLAAVVTTSGKRATSQGFTSDRSLLVGAINSSVGRKIISPALAALAMGGTPEEGTPETANPQRMFNARSSLETMAHLIDFAATVRQRRKALVLVSEGMDYDLGSHSVTEARELRQRLSDVVGAANRANLSLYAFDPRMYTKLGDDMVDRSSRRPCRIVRRSPRITCACWRPGPAALRMWCRPRSRRPSTASAPSIVSTTWWATIQPTRLGTGRCGPLSCAWLARG
jgi:VWFA-related protein